MRTSSLFPHFLLLLGLVGPTSAFVGVTPSSSRIQPLNFFKFPNVLESILPKEAKEDTAALQRETLKQTLLEACQSTPASQRDKIEAIMEQLKAYNPTTATASSPLLQKKWRMEWTTEKEINFFLDWKISNEIGQTIDADLNLNNNIEFVRGGGFYVQGKLTIPDPQGVRTNFEFETATLDLGPRWGQYQFPPVGAGWFDTIYLDETLRVDVNSRDDILICTPY